MKGFLSIRFKFLAVMSALLVFCLVVYLIIAVEVFKTDKTELVFDLNRSTVSNLAAEIETEFNGVSDKFRLYALLTTGLQTQDFTGQIFSEDSPIVYASLYQLKDKKSFKNYTDQKYVETYGLSSDFFSEELQKTRPIPFDQITKNTEFFWNATVQGGTPLIGYGRSVIIEDKKGRPTDQLAVVGYIQPGRILKALNFNKLNEVSIVDQQGHVLLHSNFEWMKENKKLSESILFQKAQTAQVNLSVATTRENDQDYLGAFAKAYQGQIIILSRVSKDEAFAAVTELVSRSLSFALIIITLSLLFAVLLSRSLTEPISILVDGMEKVSAGDLSTQIQVNSRDETKLLASSFNQMIVELKQSRDELEEINRELDQKVKDRTRQLEIQNKAVKEAQEALIKTTRLASAGEIAGRAAHEVLNPLTGILARLSSLEKKIHHQYEPHLGLMNDIFSSWKSDYTKGGFDELVLNWKKPSAVDPQWSLWQEDIHNVESIHSAFSQTLEMINTDIQFLNQEGRRIGKIIDGMRKLSRLHSDIKTYSVKKLLVDCKNIMADLFNQHNIDIIEEYDLAEDEVLIDRDEFIQATTNLMRNSLQAMNEKGRKYFLKISTQVNQDGVQIFIADNGSGVSKDHQQLLFEKQFTTKSSDEGTGLGLGISRRFIRAHGGDIEFVESSPYQLTVFKLTIPLKMNTNQFEEGAA